MLFDDDVRCPVHVADLAEAVLELCGSDYSGLLHAGGSDPLTRYELGCLPTQRDGLETRALPRGGRAESGLPSAAVRLDSGRARSLLSVRLRGAREFSAQGL
ncbi:hypothetical protein GCM10027447_28820 [Glycomyces halotolerans]